jgi:hypothetical protein
MIKIHKITPTIPVKLGHQAKICMKIIKFNKNFLNCYLMKPTQIYSNKYPILESIQI